MPGRIFFLATFSACLSVVTAFPQDSPHFIERLTTSDGLSSNKINDLAQDENGFLWIATTDGLNQFDGTEVINHFHREGGGSLSHNYIWCLEALPGNMLAIGTQAGLDFYDGNKKTFRNFYLREKKGLDEFNNSIVAFDRDAQGRLWAASLNCIFIFNRDLSLKRIIRSEFTQADAASKRIKFVQKMYPLSDGNMLLSLSNGVKIYLAAKDTVVPVTTQHRLRFLKDFILSSKDRKNEFNAEASSFKVFSRYFAIIKQNIDSLFLVNEAGSTISRCYFPFNKYPYILWSQKLVTLDSGRLLLLAHNYGIVSTQVRWTNGQPALESTGPLLFEEYEYQSALLDRQGNWWLGTSEAGLQKITPSRQCFRNIPLIDEASGMPAKYETTGISQYKNTLWVGTYGNGFFSVDLATGQSVQHRLKPVGEDQWPNFVWNVRQVHDDSLWIGTQAGLFWYRISGRTCGRVTLPGKPDLADSVAITTQFVDRVGRVWIGLGRGNGVCYFDTKNRRFTYFPANKAGGYPFRYPLAMAEDDHGNIWFVSDATSQLALFNEKTGQFATRLVRAPGDRELSNLSAIYFHRDGRLWLGTIADGLVSYDPRTGASEIFGHEQGLGNSHVSSIYADEYNRLWLVTDGALTSFDPSTRRFTNYSENDGLPVPYPSAHFYSDPQSGRLYTGGAGSLFYFPPGKMKDFQPPGRTMITSILVNGKPFMPAPGKNPRFRPWENNISIQYAAIDLTNGRATQYAYKLVGEDTGWMAVGSQRQLNFIRLEPGDYTFLVRATANGGIWSEGIASISFSITPPFTRTAWFYLILVAGIAALFYLLYRFRVMQIRRTEQVRGEISKNLHDEVGVTLTNISLSTLLAQRQLTNNHAVNKTLERIYLDSQNVSQAMREIVWSIDPKIDTLGEALPRMLRYASELLEAKGMDLQAHISPGIEQIKLGMQHRRDLYLIFKETINNLARHSKASRARIQFKVVDKKIVMEVEDNGVGFDQDSAWLNNGLRNMKERAASHNWKLDIRSAAGSGATITLTAQIA